MTFHWMRTVVAAITTVAALGTAATAQTLRVAPHSDLKVVDPVCRRR